MLNIILAGFSLGRSLGKF